MRTLELLCQKADLELRLQRTRATTASLELATLESEELVRRSKRLPHDGQEQEHRSADKGRLLKKPRLDSDVKDSGSGIAKAANKEVVTHDAAELGADTKDDREAPSPQTGAVGEVASNEAALAGAASGEDKQKGTASGEAKTEKPDNVETDELETNELETDELETDELEEQVVAPEE